LRGTVAAADKPDQQGTKGRRRHHPSLLKGDDARASPTVVG
jgi:hypothetical protein